MLIFPRNVMSPFQRQGLFRESTLQRTPFYAWRFPRWIVSFHWRFWRRCSCHTSSPFFKLFLKNKKIFRRCSCHSIFPLGLSLGIAYSTRRYISTPQGYIETAKVFRELFIIRNEMSPFRRPSMRVMGLTRIHITMNAI